MLVYVFVLAVALVAGALSGIIGTGSSIMLLPILAYDFGPKQAVPIMAIAALMANVGKLLAWWREIDWRAFAAYAITGVPAAALGARTLLVLPAQGVDVALGLFFLAMIPGRRWLAAMRFRLALWQLAVAGGFVGFLTGVVLSTGPLSVPVFTAYGLLKGAFLSTEAATSLALMVSKIATFRDLGALPTDSIIKGLIIGASVMAGSFAGKFVVQRMSLARFQNILDGLLLCSGIALFWDASSAGP
jgi:uncharacterized membrane protein YfcA